MHVIQGPQRLPGVNLLLPERIFMTLHGSVCSIKFRHARHLIPGDGHPVTSKAFYSGSHTVWCDRINLSSIPHRSSTPQFALFSSFANREAHVFKKNPFLEKEMGHFTGSHPLPEDALHSHRRPQDNLAPYREIARSAYDEYHCQSLCLFEPLPGRNHELPTSLSRR